MSHRPGAKASSDFATFPVASYIKVSLVYIFFLTVSLKPYNDILCFIGQGREAGGNHVCWPCCHPMFPWTGTSAPPRALTAAASASAPPAHGLRRSHATFSSSFCPSITFAFHSSAVDLICNTLALILPHKMDVLVVVNLKMKSVTFSSLI